MIGSIVKKDFRSIDSQKSLEKQGSFSSNSSKGKNKRSPCFYNIAYLNLRGGRK